MFPVIVRNPKRPLEFNREFGFSMYPRESEDELIVTKSLFEKSGIVLEKGYFGVNALRTYLKKKKVV